MSELQQGTAIKDRYVLKEYKGSGSFGEVWLAHDQFLEIDVAIKVYISLDARGIEEFKAEYKTAYGLSHPNLLTTTYFDVWQQRPFLVMKYCANGSAGSLVDTISEEKAWRFIRDVAAGLAFLHTQDPEPIVHQDIKPDNILIDEQGHFLITDFGISKRIRSTMRKQSKRSATSGAAAYMGPERFSKDPTPIMASDIWSLGASIYELLTGELPFCGMGGGMQANGAELPELDSRWSRELQDVMQACMAKETWNRPRAGQIVAYCEAVMRGEVPDPLLEKGNDRNGGRNGGNGGRNGGNGGRGGGNDDNGNRGGTFARHGFVSFWLIFCLLAYLFVGGRLAISAFDAYHYGMAALVLSSLSSAYGIFLLLKWRKAGYWLCFASQFFTSLYIAYLFIEELGFSYLLVAFFSTLVAMLVLYGILRIKKNGVSAWSQLQNSADMLKDKSLVYALVFVLGVSALGFGRVAYTQSFVVEREADVADISRYSQLLDECKALTASGSNRNIESLIKAKACLEEMTVIECRYGDSIKHLESDDVRTTLETKLQEGHDAWKRAAESQYSKVGDADKAIEYYKIALSLKEDASTRSSLEELEAAQVADWASNDSAVIGY